MLNVERSIHIPGMSHTAEAPWTPPRKYSPWRHTDEVAALKSTANFNQLIDQMSGIVVADHSTCHQPPAKRQKSLDTDSDDWGEWKAAGKKD